MTCSICEKGSWGQVVVDLKPGEMIVLCEKHMREHVRPISIVGRVLELEERVAKLEVNEHPPRRGSSGTALEHPEQSDDRPSVQESLLPVASSDDAFPSEKS